MPVKKRPMQGHKLDRYRFAAQTICECGWESCRHYGRGNRGQALAEWRSHIHSCEERLVGRATFEQGGPIPSYGYPARREGWEAAKAESSQ